MTALPRTRVAALALTAALAVALAGCGDDDPTTEDPAPVGSDGSPSAADSGTPPASASPSSSPSSSDSSSPSADGSSGETVTVPVYFVGDTPQGPRLFREFRRVGSDKPLEEAAALMTAGDALDPDYRTAYPDGGFAAVSHAGGEFRVELTDDAWTTPAGLDSSEEAVLAVQQLVHTLQGVQQERSPVTVVLDGTPATLFGVDTAGGVEARPPLRVLALVNVTAPEEGATVSGTFTTSGVASSFEATVPWEVRQGRKVVLDGFATAEGWMRRLWPWEAEVDVSGLAPGEYTFVARTDDPSGGEGPGPHEDSKTIVVE